MSCTHLCLKAAQNLTPAVPRIKIDKRETSYLRCLRLLHERLACNVSLAEIALKRLQMLLIGKLATWPCPMCPRLIWPCPFLLKTFE